MVSWFISILPLKLAQIEGILTPNLYPAAWSAETLNDPVDL